MWWEPVVQKWFRRHFMPRPINPASSSPLLFSSRQPAPHNDYSPELQQPLERNRPPSYTSLSLCSVCIFLQTYPFTMMTRLVYKPSSPLIFSFVVSSEVEMINSPNIELRKQLFPFPQHPQHQILNKQLLLNKKWFSKQTHFPLIMPPLLILK